MAPIAEPPPATTEPIAIQPTATALQEPIAPAKPPRQAKAKGGAPSIKTPLPADFALTPELQAWADEKGYGDLPQHLESFRDKAQAKGYQYTDWNAAFRNAVRDDWAGLRKQGPTTATKPLNGQRYPSNDPHEKHARLVAANRLAIAEWLAQDTPVSPFTVNVIPTPVPELTHANH